MASNSLEPVDHEPITLQINVAPSDHWHIRASLEHHLRIWGPQVDEILFSIDTLRSPGRRGAEWDEGRPRLAAVLTDIRTHHPNIRAIDVEYGAEQSALVSREFFGGASIPKKDCFGAPFYAYLHGLHAASNRFVLHLDADMLFGGGHASWGKEAIAAMQARPDVLFCGPLPGPPTADGKIAASIARRHHTTQRYGSLPIPQQFPTLAYGFTHMSTRVFLLDRQRFASHVGALKPMRLLRPTYPRGLGHPPFYPLETVFSRAMRRHKLIRLNMLGKAPGMWYVHPPARSSELERELPRLIERVERGNVPPEQFGDDQMNVSMYEEAAAAE
jgi:hypothetical protein